MATNSIYLVNYHPLNSEPLKSITRFSKKEAFEIAQKLYEENHVPGYERFGPGFESYYTLRMETEKWLYEEFIAIGGKPQTTHPLYFFVHDWDVVHKSWSVKIAEKIALDEIDIHDISFTFGDSCVMMNAPNRKPPFNKNALLDFFAANDGDVEKSLDEVERIFDNRVIEAQIWNDKYFDRTAVHSK